jgi:hypothetical protein
MKATVDVKSRKEADLLRLALEDPATRASAIVLGALLPLTPRERERVKLFVEDRLAEDGQPETDKSKIETKT